MPTIVALLVLGMLLLGVEIAVIPGVGLTGLFGSGLLIWGCWLAWTGHGPLWGMVAVAVSIGLSALLVWILSRTSAGRKMVLKETTEGDSADVDTLEELIGSHGVALAPLRPSGVAEINGERIDVIADEGEWVDADQPITVVRVSTNSVVVRPKNTEQ